MARTAQSLTWWSPEQERRNFSVSHAQHKGKKDFLLFWVCFMFGFFWVGGLLVGCFFFFNEKHPRLSNSLKNMVFVLISTAFSAAT